MAHNFEKSSFLHSCHHEEGVLTITFKNGKTYQYKDVPDEVHEGFKNSESAGSFYSKNIKGQFEEV